MKIGAAFSQRRPRITAGISLIECLVYIALVSVVTGAGFMALYFTTDNHRRLRRNADDIMAAVNAGERWRNDVRAARGTITAETNAAGQTLRIPQANTVVAYQFAGCQVRRQSQAAAPWVILLPAVQASQMRPDPRAHVTAWRWELTLQPSSRRGRIPPVFSFEAVPGFDAP